LRTHAHTHACKHTVHTHTHIHSYILQWNQSRVFHVDERRISTSEVRVDLHRGSATGINKLVGTGVITSTQLVEIMNNAAGYQLDTVLEIARPPDYTSEHVMSGEAKHNREEISRATVTVTLKLVVLDDGAKAREAKALEAARRIAEALAKATRTHRRDGRQVDGLHLARVLAGKGKDVLEALRLKRQGVGKARRGEEGGIGTVFRDVRRMLIGVNAFTGSRTLDTDKGNGGGSCCPCFG
jgi:hypothetical protein